jgi:hypothetical protein
MSGIHVTTKLRESTTAAVLMISARAASAYRCSERASRSSRRSSTAGKPTAPSTKILWRRAESFAFNSNGYFGLDNQDAPGLLIARLSLAVRRVRLRTGIQ